MAGPLYEIISLNAQGAPVAPLAAALKAVPGVTAVQLGQELEHPANHTIVLRWSSRDARAASLAGPARAALHAAAEAGSLSTLVFSAPDASLAADMDAALDAPCTEVVTFAQVEEAFVQRNLVAFKKGTAAHGMPETFYALSCADAELGEHRGRTPLALPGAVMLVGWESMQAHVDARAPGGAIAANLTHVESRNKGVTVYHVNLKKL